VSLRLLDTYAHAHAYVQARVGLGLLKKQEPLETIIKHWPGQSVGYAILDAFAQGVAALDVPGGYRKLEVEDWYNNAFQKGLESGRCRLGGGIQLKYDLKSLLKEGRAAVKEQAKLQACTDELQIVASIAETTCRAAESQKAHELETVEKEAENARKQAQEAFEFKPKRPSGKRSDTHGTAEGADDSLPPTPSGRSAAKTSARHPSAKLAATGSKAKRKVKSNTTLHAPTIV